MRRLFLLAVILVSLLACKRVRPPGDLIGQEELVPVLVDLHVTYAIQSSTEFRQFSQEYDSVDSQGYVFEKHNIDRALFDSTIAWYSRHPDLFTDVYDEVVMQLSQHSDSLGEKEE